MEAYLAHNNGKVLSLQQNQTHMSDEEKAMYPQGTIFEIVTMPVNTEVAWGDEYVFSNGVLSIQPMTPTELIAIRKSESDRHVALIERAFSRLVNETFDSASRITANEPKRRITGEAMDAQYRIYNLFQNSSAIGIASDISLGAKDSMVLAMRYLKVLSIAMDNITTLIHQDLIIPIEGTRMIEMDIINNGMSELLLADIASELNVDMTTITI